MNSTETAPAYLPAVTSSGATPIPLTEEQKYLFDLKGWLLFPSAIDEATAGAVRDHIYRLHNDRDSLPVQEQHTYGGIAQELLDHPVIVGALNELLAYQPLAAEDCYGFRFDGCHSTIRKAGDDNFRPHGGGGLHNLGGNSHVYRHQPGRVFSGLTRIVWELNEVGPGDGSTRFLSGSHKAAFTRPPSTNERDCKLFESYTCPAGSLVIFTEALCHTGTVWNNTERDRVAIFTCYNTINEKWHKGGPSREVIATMPPLRQTLFRGVWHGQGDNKGKNIYFDEENLAV
jgi:hypothetical protein